MAALWGNMGLDASAPALTVSFDSSGAFTGAGVSGDCHRLTMDAGLDFSFDSGANLGVSYLGTFGARQQDHGFSLRLGGQF